MDDHWDASSLRCLEWQPMNWPDLQATQITTTVCIWTAMESYFSPYFGHSSVHCLQRYSKPWPSKEIQMSEHSWGWSFSHHQHCQNSVVDLWVCFHFSLAFPNEMRDAPCGRMREEIYDKKLKTWGTLSSWGDHPAALRASYLAESCSRFPQAVGSSSVRMDCGLRMDYLMPGAALHKEQLKRTWHNAKDETPFLQRNGSLCNQLQNSVEAEDYSQVLPPFPQSLW